MEEKRIILRGDIYYADLHPVIGSEQDGIRPVLIVQNNTGNRYSPTVIAAAITSSRKKKRLPTHIPVGNVPGVFPNSIILLEQIRTLDKSRLLDFIGTVRPEVMRAVDQAINISVGQD
jgi:mRNA interferase MazF